MAGYDARLTTTVPTMPLPSEFRVAATFHGFKLERMIRRGRRIRSQSAAAQGFA
jgi:hypothetical protein